MIPVQVFMSKYSEADFWAKLLHPARIPKTNSSHDENNFWLNCCSEAQVNIIKKVWWIKVLKWKIHIFHLKCFEINAQGGGWSDVEWKKCQNSRLTHKTFNEGTNGLHERRDESFQLKFL